MAASWAPGAATGMGWDSCVLLAENTAGFGSVIQCPASPSAIVRWAMREEGIRLPCEWHHDYNGENIGANGRSTLWIFAGICCRSQLRISTSSQRKFARRDRVAMVGRLC